MPPVISSPPFRNTIYCSRKASLLILPLSRVSTSAGKCGLLWILCRRLCFKMLFSCAPLHAANWNHVEMSHDSKTASQTFVNNEWQKSGCELVTSCWGALYFNFFVRHTRAARGTNYSTLLIWNNLSLLRWGPSECFDFECIKNPLNSNSGQWLSDCEMCGVWNVGRIVLRLYIIKW